MSTPLRRTLAALVTAAATVSVVVAGVAPSASAAGAAPAPQLGVYAGAGATGVTNHTAFDSFMGQPSPYAVDFASASNGWKDMESPSWLLDPWARTNTTLVYSLQMFPDSVQNNIGGPAALAQCSAGTYNSHWLTLAKTLVAKGLDDTVVRPGWEMNGDWFGWSAAGNTSTYIGCYRQIVTTMRSAAGQHLKFNWNPNLGTGTFPAELAYPGDAYVDQVGVDLYDWSWVSGLYDTKATQTPAQRLAAEQTVWQSKLIGDHGLRFWSDFSQTHGKPMSLPEWGLANRFADAFGGGDDPYFIQKAFEFIYDPANDVTFASYFNTTSPDAEHRLVGTTEFPNSAALYKQLVATPPVPAAAPVCTPFTAPAPAPATAYPLLTSPTGAYANATKLDGTTLGWALRGWIAADSTIKHVQFYTDNTAGTGTPMRDEWTAPYDLGGSSSTGSSAVDTTTWATGVHTVTARVFLNNGTSVLSTVSVIKPSPASCP